MTGLEMPLLSPTNPSDIENATMNTFRHELTTERVRGGRQYTVEDGGAIIYLEKLND
jgi:hypothetical protein